jgi:hypothetical protein
MLLYDKMAAAAPGLDYNKWVRPVLLRAETKYRDNPEEQERYKLPYGYFYSNGLSREMMLQGLEDAGYAVYDEETMDYEINDPIMKQAVSEIGYYIFNRGMAPSQYITDIGGLYDEVSQDEPEERQGEPDYTTGDGKPMRGTGIWQDIKNWMHKQAYKVLRHHPAFGWLPENPTGSGFRPDRMS